jgi:hypothetical protein
MIYVSGPMAGYPEHNFPAFKEASARLRSAGFEVVCPTECAMPCGCEGALRKCGELEHEWADFVRWDLVAMLQKGKGLAMLPGWEKSRGANLERYVALALNMDVRLLEEWL